jgi:transcriptional regulator with XRE-family HTH domain
MVGVSVTTIRRVELAAFLRTRRARLTPEAVGLPPGFRRRTPGLRREELAQLAGVGVTWYTWLEQGRPINASVQVLDAIARALRLDQAERKHLYHLADVPTVPEQIDCGALDPNVQQVLDAFLEVPAVVYSARLDLLAWNRSYALLFPALAAAQPPYRNVLWHLFTGRPCCGNFKNGAEEMPRMVATMRSSFGQHVGEPAWETFVRELSQQSPDFTRMWASHDVAAPGPQIKIYEHRLTGELRMVTTSFAVSTTPEARMVVYTPQDAETRDRLILLRTTHASADCCALHNAAA